MSNRLTSMVAIHLVLSWIITGAQCIPAFDFFHGMVSEAGTASHPMLLNRETSIYELRKDLDFTKIKKEGVSIDSPENARIVKIDGQPLLMKKKAMMHLSGEKDFDQSADEIQFLLFLQGLTNIPEFHGFAFYDMDIYIFQQALHRNFNEKDVQQKFNAKPMIDRLRHYHELTKTLIVMHAEGIFNREIMPLNLVVDFEKMDRIYILNFGIANFRSGSDTLGSTTYWSPERRLNTNRSFDDNSKKKALINNYSRLNQLDDSWGLVISLLAIETASSEENIFTLDCLSEDDLTFECTEEIIKRFKDHIDSKHESYELSCGAIATQLLFAAVKHSLRYNAVNRISLAEFGESLGSAIEMCESFQANSGLRIPMPSLFMKFEQMVSDKFDEDAKQPNFDLIEAFNDNFPSEQESNQGSMFEVFLQSQEKFNPPLKKPDFIAIKYQDDLRNWGQKTVLNHLEILSQMPKTGMWDSSVQKIII